MLWLFLGTLFSFVFLGIPVAFSLGLSNMVIMSAMDFDFVILTKKMIQGMNSFPLLAIPFFMFVGEIMNTGGIAKRLVKFADSLVGFITGGLGHVNILASMFFGGISGSAIADTAAIGGLLIPPMVEEDYPADYSSAITASSAVIGIIIPPSIPFILYGITTNTSIAQIFMAGIIPGILVGSALMVTTYFTTKRNSYGNAEATASKSFSFKEVISSFKEASLALSLPLLIVGGILGGVFTATEAGAIAVILSLVLSIFVYKEIDFGDIPDLLLKTARVTATVLFLCGMAMVTAWLLTTARVPYQLAELINSVTSSQIVIMLIINALLLVVGCVMDLTPALLILAPILLPIVEQLGISPVYFGVIMCINLGIGLITPPVGTVLYVACGVGNVKMEQLVKSILPFLFTLMVILILLIFFPQLVMFIPNLMMG
ncbi:TRAP transporter, DctM subunit [Halobacteroides halobius DSM 5150]|uniref:TRAP transporter, DctM subunit n=1 Tax=Halobacteroides halobius (strain ATCC 35273 / DSM 5150 / MD-1) TaxID=748449 RepID=L0KEB3_HALHC|nr:TRAP transporter large permease [Halobacteroides halobius]AGB42403.1 TRAP transporter, DctM subunit [Halobacteroides halobius DSM 5150]